ncbi:3'(2'),5'-bisphosphate nucleotidase CysQ [Azospirillum doebereinerae]|uniref:3'(2'),5'-bisphosphate nucleotidase CysQ n=1 Tax=Azospirillum doebereinerae TaxID=92933 RepID=A0A433J4X6_9PROT|nr:3'(2'),5'-bisphosphate nucleotidase CysQ [Azospirillum doebereinerae]MCG5240843.1 3'(2'),5'-bisphosphate nucleotidase CysQ [Azospirillum doebereinerae]RUQ67484.1 3'(2'),5'-bisphosphate nucleotidase [Azospirillum doebereinerae]
MPDIAVASLLPTVRTIAHEAGQVILRFYNDGIDVATKVDGSPVTQADHAAEAVILPALHHLTPGIPIVAEEATAAGHRPDISGGRFWLVDPLDGTKEFISRNGEFTVNIALIDNGVPVLGVVYAPATGDLYAAAGPGTAVHWAEGRHDHAITVRKPPPDGLTVVASRSHGTGAEIDAFLAQYVVKDRLTCGSSLKFCTVARGKADLYPRFGPTSEWDTAAGHAVLVGAGGRVEQPDGSPLLYGKPDILNPNFVAYGW